MERYFTSNLKHEFHKWFESTTEEFNSTKKRFLRDAKLNPVQAIERHKDQLQTLQLIYSNANTEKIRMEWLEDITHKELREYYERLVADFTEKQTFGSSNLNEVKAYGIIIAKITSILKTEHSHG